MVDDCTKKPQATPGYQPLKSFLAKSVEPGKVSDIQLSGGTTKPYFYSLGVNSTCPFVSVEGSGGIQKEFSWGETIIIPPGQTVKLKNASKHKGDIHIQSGRDEHNKPRRISFPVLVTPPEFITEPPVVVVGAQRVGEFIDTRRVVRAWLNINPTLVCPFAPASFYVFGFYEQHTAPPIIEPSGFNAAWQADVAIIPPATSMGNIPLSRTNLGSGLSVDAPIAAAFPDYISVYYAANVVDNILPYTDARQDYLITLEY